MLRAIRADREQKARELRMWLFENREETRAAVGKLLTGFRARRNISEVVAPEGAPEGHSLGAEKGWEEQQREAGKGKGSGNPKGLKKGALRKRANGGGRHRPRRGGLF